MRLALDLFNECANGAVLDGTLDMNLSLSFVKSIFGIVVRSPFNLVLRVFDSGEEYFLDKVEFITI